MTRAAKWPQHPDGKPKTMGEMSAEERREQVKHAVAKIQRELDNPRFKSAVKKFLETP